MSKILNHQASLELLRQHTGIPWRTIDYSQLIPHMCAISLRDVNQPTVQDNLLYVPSRNPFITNGDKLLDIIHGAQRDLLAIVPTFNFNLTDSVPPIELPPFNLYEELLIGEVKLNGAVKIRYPSSALKNLNLSLTDLNSISISASKTMNDITSSLRITDFNNIGKSTLTIGSTYLLGSEMTTSNISIHSDLSVSAEYKTEHFTNMYSSNIEISQDIGFEFTGRIMPVNENTKAESSEPLRSKSVHIAQPPTANLILLMFVASNYENIRLLKKTAKEISHLDQVIHTHTNPYSPTFLEVNPFYDL